MLVWWWAHNIFYSTPCTVAWRAIWDSEEKNVAHLVLTTKACSQADKFTKLISIDMITPKTGWENIEKREKDKTLFSVV